MSWLEFKCPGCGRTKTTAPDHTYKICSRCGAAHCPDEHDFCGCTGCTGVLHEALNLGGNAGRSSGPPSRVRYDPKF